MLSERLVQDYLTMERLCLFCDSGQTIFPTPYGLTLQLIRYSEAMRGYSWVLLWDGNMEQGDLHIGPKQFVAEAKKLIKRYNDILTPLFWRYHCQRLSVKFTDALSRTLSLEGYPSLSSIRMPVSFHMDESVVLSCFNLAKFLHSNQRDKAGVAYINHPMTVASLFDDVFLKSIAYLHDVLEDTAVTCEELRQARVPEAVLTEVKRLSHARGVPYNEYLRSVCKSDAARYVKCGDMYHNMQIDRIAEPSEADYKRCQKYVDGLAVMHLTKWGVPI